MGIFLRKSKKIGAFRVNLSKSGLGVSTGIKGARIGLNSKGKAYVFGGKSGVYYRKSLGGITNKTKTPGGAIVTDTTGKEYLITHKMHIAYRVIFIIFGIVLCSLGLLFALITLGGGSFFWGFGAVMLLLVSILCFTSQNVKEYAEINPED